MKTAIITSPRRLRPPSSGSISGVNVRGSSCKDARQAEPSTRTPSGSPNQSGHLGQDFRQRSEARVTRPRPAYAPR